MLDGHLGGAATSKSGGEDEEDEESSVVRDVPSPGVFRLTVVYLGSHHFRQDQPAESKSEPSATTHARCVISRSKSVSRRKEEKSGIITEFATTTSKIIVTTYLNEN